ncbi:MAG: 4-hydroxy-3-methylbut-2-enyl diphosphate reductase [Lachnospiraceae bacterium]|nr:4-hydroxy-3-methylbut-2-enyl diphosphate reductase [Lachnospiraceae bacterium]
MEVITARSAGFCFGVRRAVDTVYELSEGNKKIYTFGPIIHNETVVNDLSERGVGIVDSLDEIRGLDPADTVIVIRSHGVSEEIYDAVSGMGFEIVDTTCPFVKRIHEAVRNASEDGQEILILGSPDHPEVQGIMGWCHGPVQIIENVESARSYKPLTGRPITLVSQTTFNHKKFEDIVEILISGEYNVNVMNTICNATLTRQNEAEELASRADVMIVIGGKHSSNTRKLYDICAARCEHTYFIETLDDLNLEVPKSVRLVGITAGASTPQNLIEEVQKEWKN